MGGGVSGGGRLGLGGVEWGSGAVAVAVESCLSTVPCFLHSWFSRSDGLLQKRAAWDNMGIHNRRSSGACGPS